MKKILLTCAGVIAVFTVSCGGDDRHEYDWGYASDSALTDTGGGDMTAGDLQAVDTTPGDGTREDLPGDDTAADTAGTDEFQAPDAPYDTNIPGDAAGDAAAVADTTGTDTSFGGFDLTGTWAQLHVTSVLSKPFMGSPTPAATTSILLVKITFESGAYFLETDLCDLRLGQTSAVVSTVVPKAFIDSIGNVKREFELSEDGGSVTFTDPRHVDLYGLRLDNPETDPLPATGDAEAPSVYDQDGDGHPGMTVQLKGLVSGDFYLVQRNISSMTGPVESADRFDGLITSATEQVYVGASNTDLMNFVPETSPDNDPSHSYFRHTRIDPSWGCQDILDNEESLFAR